jgi:hypothetical protein
LIFSNTFKVVFNDSFKENINSGKLFPRLLKKKDLKNGNTLPFITDLKSL